MGTPLLHDQVPVKAWLNLRCVLKAHQQRLSFQTRSIPRADLSNSRESGRGVSFSWIMCGSIYIQRSCILYSCSSIFFKSILKPTHSFILKVNCHTNNISNLETLLIPNYSCQSSRAL